MKKLLYLLALVLGISCLWACSESSDEVEEFGNWKERNATFMRDTLAYANRAIATAKAQYGDAWESHCDWRVFPSYMTTAGGKTTWEDSIAVRIMERGTNVGSPLFTDSVKVTYAGRLIPSPSYPTMGYCFDHTGVSNKLAEVMDPRFETPATFLVSGLVEGFTTALLHMNVGDYWRVFIPSSMAYGKSGSNSIPGYSTLTFDMRLKGYYKPKGK